METIGNLVDKLVIVSLKKYFNENAEIIDDEKIKNLASQQQTIRDEITTKLAEGASSGKFPQMPQHKTGYNEKYRDIFMDNSSSVGEAIGNLIEANIKMWHTQNDIMNFTNVPADKKDDVVDKCSRYNLERNKAMDEIDELLNDLMKTV